METKRPFRVTWIYGEGLYTSAVSTKGRALTKAQSLGVGRVVVWALGACPFRNPSKVTATGYCAVRQQYKGAEVVK